MSAEIERMLANMIRVGRVKAVQYDPPLVQVEIGGLQSAMVPWAEPRAGSTRTWSAPSVGEQRLLFSPYGDMSQAVLGPAIFQDDHPAPVSSGDQDHTVFADGSTVDYNAASNTYTMTLAGAAKWIINCKQATINAVDAATVNTKAATVNAENTADVNTKTATIKASSGITLDTPLVHATAALTVDGLLTYKGGLAGSGGAGATMDGNMSLKGDFSSTGGMTNNGKQVGSALRVTGVQGGSSTSGPTA